MSDDPTITNPDNYKTVFENDRVRVLEYRDVPGTKTKPHSHPDSVMVTVSSFSRRLSRDGNDVDVELSAHRVGRLEAQRHTGENIGTTDTHVMFIELKD